MNTYDRLFGAGPRGALISMLLLVMAFSLEEVLSLPAITDNNYARYLIFGLCSILTIAIITWSLVSLPPKDRGKRLITSGAFKYFRHPLYAAFISFFNYGFAVLLNNWIYVAWALLLWPLWHLNIQREEALMEKEFGREYNDYCKKTGRFFVRLMR